jgi:hypothetical protein
MLIVYSYKTSNRLEYIIEILSEYLQLENYLITTDVEIYKRTNGYKINYSNQKIYDKEYHIIPHSLLFEENIIQQKIEVEIVNDLPYFFKNPNSNNFDVLASAFYLLTRYEEYLPHSLDEYGRFAHTNSIAFKNNFLHKPIANSWFRIIKSALQNQNLDKAFTERQFYFTPTYDIDMAWSYLHKNIFKQIAGIFVDFFTLKFSTVINRKLTLFRLKKDPSDVYNWLNKLHSKIKLKPIYFFLVAKTNKGFDKNINRNNLPFKNLLKEISVESNVALHPSWQSVDSIDVLNDEIQYLQNTIQQPIHYSRQHYIRFFLPNTYHELIEVGITHDYSMGYGSINGFRASYCLPFKWFDIERNEKTTLTIVPFCYMDANSIFEQKLSPIKSKEELLYYYNVVKNEKGCLVTIFHNHFLTEEKKYKEWRKMYESFLIENFT